MISAPAGWYRVGNVAEIPSPALLVYPERIEANVDRLISMVGDPRRVRPHVKTHKMAEVVTLQQRVAINQFKCATIAEAEMVAGCGAREVLLAYQPVGPTVDRLMALIAKFPRTQFATIVDNSASIHDVAGAAQSTGCKLEMLLDVDCGMHRTGVMPGQDAIDLYRLISGLPSVIPGGLHAYDGHIDDHLLGERARATEASTAPVIALQTQLVAMGLRVPRLVVGGTPTFPIHARIPDRECSPGTFILWDAGYAAQFPDLGFIPAAVLLTRVISKPGANRLCLDLGHKAIASEMEGSRVKLPDLPDATAVMHNEEHLLVETARADAFAIGDELYGIPRHICPTVALHRCAIAVRDGRADGQWNIAARDRKLTI